MKRLKANNEIEEDIKRIIEEERYNCSVEEFENSDEVDWNKISVFQDLSENFIREFQDKVDWEWISIEQNLSEDFIREFQDKVDWRRISRFQDLSENVVKEFKDKGYIK